jgi:hypothetical protein
MPALERGAQSTRRWKVIMARDADLRRFIDESALRRLIMQYAQCIDRRDEFGFAALFATGAVLDGETFRFGTPEEIRAVPGSMKVYTKTYHTIWNQLFEINGDGATGEVYSAAHHLTRVPDETFSDFVMTITYRDRYVRARSGWLFLHRHLTVEYVETRIVEKLKLTPQLARMRDLGDFATGETE